MNDKEYIISCCSTVDLTEERLEERGIQWVPFHFSINGREYLDDMGKSVSYEDFYRAMSEDADTRTSQVNYQEFIDFFTPFLEEGKDILHLTLSTGISGVYNSATLAAEELRQNYPDRKIYIVDSLGASSGYGMLAELAAQKREEGHTIDRCKEFVEEMRLKVNHWFFSTDLKFYVKGGRISKTSGFVGSMLKICPLLNMNAEGKLIPREKIHGKKHVIKTIVDRMEMNAKNGLDYSGPCMISQADCLADAEEVRSLILERFPNIKDVTINWVGTTIGSHTGPGTVALFFIGKERGE